MTQSDKITVRIEEIEKDTDVINPPSTPQLFISSLTLNQQIEESLITNLLSPYLPSPTPLDESSSSPHSSPTPDIDTPNSTQKRSQRSISLTSPPLSLSTPPDDSVDIIDQAFETSWGFSKQLMGQVGGGV